MRTAIGMHGFFSRRRLPVIRQTELAECGLACLAMVANYYGYNATLSRLRLTHSVSAKGMTLRTMISIAAKLGLLRQPQHPDRCW